MRPAQPDEFGDAQASGVADLDQDMIATGWSAAAAIALMASRRSSTVALRSVRDCALNSARKCRAVNPKLRRLCSELRFAAPRGNELLVVRGLRSDRPGDRDGGRELRGIVFLGHRNPLILQ